MSGPLDRRLWLITLTVIAVTFGFYWYYADWGGDKIDRGIYRLLGAAFLHGHTYLNLQPYTHVTLDTSLYKGRFYLYFGPVPALLWVLFKWCGYDLGDQQLALTFCCAGSAALILLLADMVKRKALPPYMLPVMALPVCFGTWLPMMLRHPSPMPYSAAIASAYCFTALGIGCLWYGSFLESRRAACYWKIAGGVCFGCAVGSRLIYICDALVLFVVWVASLRAGSWRDKVRESLILALPLGFCMAVLAYYNYVRFDAFMESGFNYQVGPGHGPYYYSYYHVNQKTWGLSYMAGHAYTYLLRPMPWAKIWPWSSGFGIVTVLKSGLPHAYAFGLLSNCVFSLWCLWLLWRIRACRSWLGGGWPVVCGVMAATAAISILMFSYYGITNRYMVDFAPWYMLLATWGYTDAWIKSHGRTRKLVAVTGAAMSLVTVYVGLANSFCGMAACGAH